MTVSKIKYKLGYKYNVSINYTGKSIFSFFERKNFYFKETISSDLAVLEMKGKKTFKRCIRIKC
jgi:hypothetical protein